MVTGSLPSRSSSIASSPSSIMSRCFAGSMPIMKASDGQCARSDADHEAAPGEVVQQHQAVGQHERVVIRQRRHAGAEADVLRALGRGGDEDLGGGDDLVSSRMVLAEPGLIEPELIQMLDQLQIALEGQRRILADRVERGQENAEIQAISRIDGRHVDGASSLGGFRDARGSCRARPACAVSRRPRGCPPDRRWR